MQLYGYLRENGDVGFRNNVLVVASVACAAETARRIARGFAGVRLAVHMHGCGQLGTDYEQTVRTLAGSGINPNIAAVLVVGLGCEKIIAAELAVVIRGSGKPVDYINIQEAGGTEKTVRRGREIVRELLAHAGRCQRQPVDYSRLIVGVNCGGSDTSSGIAANPAVGEAADCIVDAGGTVVLAEVSEFIGA
jgi:altronate dehydratase large subunit